jgi:tRNA dimethylallyltransferase
MGIRRNRETLYRRINERCEAMFRAGLPGEVRRLWEAGYSPRDPGLRAIGYREFFIEDEGNYRISEDLAAVETLTAMNSRRYAKRQISFFASVPDVIRVDAENAEARITEELKSFLRV